MLSLSLAPFQILQRVLSSGGTIATPLSRLMCFNPCIHCDLLNQVNTIIPAVNTPYLHHLKNYSKWFTRSKNTVPCPPLTLCILQFGRICKDKSKHTVEAICKINLMNKQKWTITTSLAGALATRWSHSSATKTTSRFSSLQYPLCHRNRTWMSDKIDKI